MQPNKLPPQMQAGPIPTSGKATLSMILGLVSVLCGCLTGLPAMIVGFFAMSEISRSRGALGGKGMAITGVVAGILTTLLHTGLVVMVVFTIVGGGVSAARNAAYRIQSSNDLKQIGISTHLVHDANAKFPHVGNDGPTREGLSWRVEILPYLEQAQLFERFDHESGWNSSQNFPLAQERPEVYRAKLAEFPPDATPYLSPVSALPSGQVKMGIEDDAKFSAIVDGTSNTIMFVLADLSTVQGPWTMGYDLPVNPNNPAQGLQVAEGRYLVMMCDGSSREISTSIDPQSLLNLMQRNDGNAVEIY